MASLKKNIAGQNFSFCMITTAGAADASATVAVKVIKDNGSQGAGGGTVTNAGNGQYNYAPTQAETNATDVGFLFTATGDVPVNLDFLTDIVGATSGLPLVGVSYINEIAATTVTTISAVIGQAQALAFNANNFLKVSLNDILGTTLTETAGQLAAGFKSWFNVASPTSTMNLVTAVTTTTNLTNAPTSGDLTATMKASVTTAATAATPTAAGVTGVSFPASVASSTQLPVALTANGNIKASLVEILTTALTETTGQLAAGFKKFFNVASPVLTTASVNQTGDAYARLGAPAGASVSSDIAAIEAQTVLLPADPASQSAILAKLPAALTANGNIKASLVEILTTTLTETTGQIAGAFKKFFNTSLPSLTTNGVDQTGDSYGRLGVPAGASVSADIAQVESKVVNLPTDPASQAAVLAKLPTALTANGNIKASLVEIISTTLTETTGQIAGAFKKFFNVTGPTLTTNGTDQTGDSYTRLGAPAGASIAADIAAIASTIGVSCANIALAVWTYATRILTAGTNIVLAKGTGVTGFNDIAATAIVSGGAITTASGKVSEVALVDILTTYTSNTPQTGDGYARLGAPAGASVSADVAAVKSDTGSTLTDVVAIKTKTDNLPADPASESLIIAATTALANAIAALNNLSSAQAQAACASALTAYSTATSTNVSGAEAAILAAITALNNLSSAQVTATLVSFAAAEPTESYAAVGVTPTRDQFLFMILALLNTFNITGVTETYRKLDNTTAAMTYTLDDPNTPTAHTRTT